MFIRMKKVNMKKFILFCFIFFFVLFVKVELIYLIDLFNVMMEVYKNCNYEFYYIF